MRLWHEKLKSSLRNSWVNREGKNIEWNLKGIDLGKHLQIKCVKARKFVKKITIKSFSIKPLSPRNFDFFIIQCLNTKGIFSKQGYYRIVMCRFALCSSEKFPKLIELLFLTKFIIHSWKIWLKSNRSIIVAAHNFLFGSATC